MNRTTKAIIFAIIAAIVKILIYLIISSFIGTTIVCAATVYCIRTGAWTDHTIWSGNAVPAAGDDVMIAGGHTVTISGSTTAICKALQVGWVVEQYGYGVILIENGGSLRTSGDIILGVAGGGTGGILMTHGTIRVGGSILTPNGNFNLQAGEFVLSPSAHATIPGGVYPALRVESGSVTAAGRVRVQGPLFVSAGASFDVGPDSLFLAARVESQGTIHAGTMVLTGQQYVASTSEITVDNLCIASGASVDAPTWFHINRDFIIEPGAIFAPGASRLTIGGDFTNRGTFHPDASSVTLTGSGRQNITGGNFHVVSLVGSGRRVAMSDMTVHRTLSVGQGVIFDAGRFEHHIKGLWILDGTAAASQATITFDGTTPQTIPAGLTVDSLNLLGGNMKTAAGPFVANRVYISDETTLDAGPYLDTVKGNWWNDGDLVAGTGTIVFKSPNPQIIYSLPAFNNLVLTGAGEKSAFASVRVSGDFRINPAAVFRPGPYTCSFGGQVTVLGTLVPGSGTTSLSGNNQTIPSITFNNLVLRNGIKTASGPLTVNGNLTVENGTRFEAGSYTHTVGGNMTNNGTLVGDGMVRLSGSTRQYLSGMMSLANLEVNNNSGVHFSHEVFVSDTLRFINGRILLDSSRCVLPFGAVISGADQNRFVVTRGTGGLIRGISVASQRNFPVGPDENSYNPLDIVLKPGDPAESFLVRASYLDSSIIGFSTLDTSRWVRRAWTVTEGTFGGNNVKLILHWNHNHQGSHTGITDTDPIRLNVCRFNGVQYDSISEATGFPSTSDPLQVSTNGYELTSFAFAPFIIGSPVTKVDARVFLGGPYNPVTGRMDATLNLQGYLAQRYGVPVHPNAVDSIAIEVRDSLTAAASTTRKFAPAWLLTDGSIREFRDTTQRGVSFDIPPGRYYVVVHHANHLPVMSAMPQTLGAFAAIYDFTTSQASAYGTSPMLQLGSRYGLYPGDADGSGIIAAADRNNVFGQLNAAGYNRYDLNLSGIVTAADANIVLQNLNRAGQVP